MHGPQVLDYADITPTGAMSVPAVPVDTRLGQAEHVDIFKPNRFKVDRHIVGQTLEENMWEEQRRRTNKQKADSENN